MICWNISDYSSAIWYDMLEYIRLQFSNMVWYVGIYPITPNMSASVNFFISGLNENTVFFLTGSYMCKNRTMVLDIATYGAY